MFEQGGRIVAGSQLHTFDKTCNKAKNKIIRDTSHTANSSFILFFLCRTEQTLHSPFFSFWKNPHTLFFALPENQFFFQKKLSVIPEIPPLLPSQRRKKQQKKTHPPPSHLSNSLVVDRSKLRHQPHTNCALSALHTSVRVGDSLERQRIRDVCSLQDKMAHEWYSRFMSPPQRRGKIPSSNSKHRGGNPFFL